MLKKSIKRAVALGLVLCTMNISTYAVEFAETGDKIVETPTERCVPKRPPLSYLVLREGRDICFLKTKTIKINSDLEKRSQAYLVIGKTLY